jgi:hypothetical protein
MSWLSILSPLSGLESKQHKNVMAIGNGGMETRAVNTPSHHHGAVADSYHGSIELPVTGLSHKIKILHCSTDIQQSKFGV